MELFKSKHSSYYLFSMIYHVKSGILVEKFYISFIILAFFCFTLASFVCDPSQVLAADSLIIQRCFNGRDSQISEVVSGRDSQNSTAF